MTHRARAHLKALFAAVLWLALCRNAAGSEPIVTTDLLRLRSVTSIDVSRDGLHAVIAVRSVATAPPADAAASVVGTQDQPRPSGQNADPDYRYQSHLYLLELTDPNAQPRRLTFGDRNDVSPQFSPDGRRIAFIRSPASTEADAGSRRRGRETEPAAQAWVIRIDGGEARQATNFKHGCEGPQWSPDGRRILVSSTIPMTELDGAPAWPMERPNRTWRDAAADQAGDGEARPPATATPRPDGTREEIRAWLERNAARENPIVINRLEFHDEQRLRNTMRFAHLFLVDADAAEPVADASARRVTGGFYDHEEPAFMPDGQSVVYCAKKPADQHIDRVLARTIWRINSDGTADRQVLALEGWTFSSPRPSRDGSALAYSAQRLDEPAFRQSQLGISSVTDDTISPPAWLTDETVFEGSVGDFKWVGSQAALTFNTALRGGFPLFTVNAGLARPAALVREVDGAPVGVHAFGLSGNTVVYAATTAANPCVLRVRDARSDRPVWDLNPWISQKALSTPVEGWITRPDNTRIQYWLMEPVNREAGRKYPLLLSIHGGPAAMWGPGEATMWHEHQLLCSWGFGVVYANPRGSGGYGYEFQRKNFQDWGEGPAGDVLAAVDQAILKDWVDRDKLLVSGGSYAGYLTAWIIAHDHRFKAAVAQRGVYDLRTFYGEGKAWRLVPWTMGGPPFDARFNQIIERNSPFNFVSRIRTPLLIEHGSDDLRTGVSQSEMLYRALKDLNRPVEYLRYPGAGHDMSRTGNPLQRMDRLNRIIEWFERFIDNPHPAPVPSGN